MISNYLPAKVRKTVYAILGVAIALEAVWDLVPAALEGKVLASLSALGFGLAFSQTSDPDV